MAADGGEDLVEALRGGERRAAALGVHPDREDAVHARLARRGHQLVLGRGAVVEVGVRVDHWGLGNRGGELADRAAARAVAELGGAQLEPLVAERGEQLRGRLGHVGREQHGQHAQALGERAQRRLELGGRAGVLRQLPRRLLLDVAVEPPHARPDAVERLRDLGAVEQARDLVGEPVEVGAQLGVDRRRRAPCRRSSGRSC